MSISYGDLPNQRNQITCYATYRYFCSSEYSISLVSPIYKESCTFTQPIFLYSIYTHRLLSYYFDIYYAKVFLIILNDIRFLFGSKHSLILISNSSESAIVNFYSSFQIIHEAHLKFPQNICRHLLLAMPTSVYIFKTIVSSLKILFEL